MEHTTLGGGCFWCVEAAFEEIEGVDSVVSGYAGGHAEDPTYREVCAETTGHAEVVRLGFDPETISFPELLEVFFTIHDPTTQDREGPDVGSQYRSAIYPETDAQLETAREFIEQLEADGVYDSIVTEVKPLETFYEAEAYHQNYFEKNPTDAYCRMHAAPKVEKVREQFTDSIDGSAR